MEVVRTRERRQGRERRPVSERGRAGTAGVQLEGDAACGIKRQRPEHRMDGETRAVEREPAV